MPDSFSSLPSGRLIAFHEASLAKGPFQHSLFLWVRGPCPGAERAVRLAPHIHQGTPDYWVIEVKSVRADRAAAAMCSCDEGGFACSLPLTGITGRRGIEIVGADRSVRIDIERDG